MNDPTIRLDDRFSDPGARPTDWATTREVLETAQISWLTTVRADGRPHVTPLVAVWLDGKLCFGTGATEQKCLNLTANPHVVLTTGRNSWDDGLDVMVEGEARRVTDRPTLERLAAAYLEKWDGSWKYEVGDDGLRQGGNDALIFAVEPHEGAHVRPTAHPASDTSMLSTVEFTHTSAVPARG